MKRWVGSHPSSSWNSSNAVGRHVDAALEMERKLFALPQEKLLKLHVDKSQGLKGYLPFQFQNGSRSRGAFSMGRDYTNPEQHFVATAPSDTMTINQWPEDDLPEFRTVIYDYCKASTFDWMKGSNF